MIIITFPDGSKDNFEKGTTCMSIAERVSPRLAKDAVAAKVNGRIVDLSFKINEDSNIEILTGKEPEGLEVIRHSCAHLMAQAILRLFPNTKLTIGPVVENGFYYDVDSEKTFKPEDLSIIEQEMNNIVNEDLEITREEITKNEALKIFASNKYKIELIEEMNEKVSIYRQGEFLDLCRGPHVPRTSRLRAWKLTKVAGAYWRGNANNKQLQRIYGVAFNTKKELDEYLKILEEAEKRDHRKIGKEMELFMVHEYAPGMPFFLPKGMTVLIELLKFVREESYGPGYNEVRTPQILNAELWKKSGHWEHYKDDMFHMHHAEDNIDIGIKPMNCPAHMLIFKKGTFSYKDLPYRIAETTTLYRNEKSGTLTGLVRVRSLSQDDTHIFVTKEQIEQEIIALLEKIKKIYKIFNLKIDEIHLSTRPEHFLGEKETWDIAENNLINALKLAGLDYKINEGDGAFYGPKIDVKVKDALGRQWQLATIQLDFQMPQRFELHYDDIDGQRKTPVVIHRAILGSLERFFGIIIEHFAGRFPLWLSPVHAVFLPIADRHIEYCKNLKNIWESKGLRVEIDSRTESTPKKVRDSQIKKIPLMITIGDKEIQNNTLAVRNLDGKVKFGISNEDFLNKILENIKNRNLTFDF
ncbi:MAG: threonine--tRNA ligase [Candidatus Woesearchaeota archaeon]|nr:MAG: threonine--tRNA ligase [Candidatus Woesearchaeota archaeon]